MGTIGVSIPVPSPYAERLHAARRAAGDPLADAVPAHVTLMPPTAVDRPTLERLRAHLCDVCARYRPFRMTLRGTGTFRPVSPVVFVAVAEGISACEQLERAVRSGPVERQLDFPYHPHITIAHGVPDEALARAFDELAAYTCSVQVSGFSLYEHGPDGVWRPYQSFPFAAL